jgi:AcrR family transcriptional regulator
MVEEIKATARRHLAAEGANLSLRAVAREMGMVSSALYRYFPSRDDLLTALIIDAYDALADAAERADAELERADLRGRWLAACRAVRRWALANPAEYALIYGSPVPGYVAPQDTVEPSTRPVVVLGAILDDAHRAGELTPAGDRPPPDVLHAELAQVKAVVAPGVSETDLARAMIAWTELFGAISFELFGRFKNTITDLAAWYDHQARVLATFIGLTEPLV